MFEKLSRVSKIHTKMFSECWKNNDFIILNTDILKFNKNSSLRLTQFEIL